MVGREARVLEEKVAVVKIGQKFEGMSMSGGRGGSERDVKNVHGGQWKYSRGSEGFNDRRMQKQRDSSLVWVRKGNTSDGDVTGVRSSGKDCHCSCVQNFWDICVVCVMYMNIVL